MSMNVLFRVTVASATMAVIFGIPVSPLLAQPTATTARLRFRAIIPDAETKPVGKYLFKFDKTEYTIDLAADGTAKYEAKTSDNAITLTAMLKDGELKVDCGNGKFLTYKVKFQGYKMILTSTHLEVNQEMPFDKIATPLEVAAPKPVPPVPPANAEAKPVGKYRLKFDTTEIAIEIAADGSAKYVIKIDGKSQSFNAKLEDGKLKIENGDGTFLNFNLKLRDDNLILTGGDLKEKQEVYAKQAANPAVVVGPKIVPPNEPKAVAKKFEKPKLPPGFDKPAWDVSALEEKFTIVKCEWNQKTNQIIFQFTLKEDYNSTAPFCRMGFCNAAGIETTWCAINFDPLRGTKLSGKKGETLDAVAHTTLSAIEKEMWEKTDTIKFRFE